jgi:hypothetical protein
MSNILNNDGEKNQNPDGVGTDDTLDPVAPQEPKLRHDVLGTPSVASDPEAPVGTGMNPP